VFRVHEYDLIAEWYARDRSLITGVPEVTSLVASLAADASVLDVGCGTGMPITTTLLLAGCNVIGVDSSRRMLERFEANCPGTPFIYGPIQSANLGGHRFDAAVAWGVLFHLEYGEQRKAIAKVASVLKPGGLFLFTAGDQAGSKQGKPMNGVPFRYWSFTVDGYRKLLHEFGLTLLNVQRDAGENIYYLARKEAA